MLAHVGLPLPYVAPGQPYVGNCQPYVDPMLVLTLRWAIVSPMLAIVALMLTLC